MSVSPATRAFSSPPGAFGLLAGLAQEAAFGRFTFNGRYTNPNQVNTQPAHAFADFLLGYPVTTFRSTAYGVNSIRRAVSTPRKRRSMR